MKDDLELHRLVKYALEMKAKEEQGCRMVNVEKIVEELGKESYQEFCDSPRIVDLKDAIEIIRKVGDEDE